MGSKKDYEKKSIMTFGDLKEYFALSGANVSIPLLQRNYKWDRECAAELAEDLLNQYLECKKDKTLGLITLYIQDEEVQILDGQQRLITLCILSSYIEKYSKVSIMPDFCFERDYTLAEGDKRKRFLDECFLCNNIFGCKEKYLYTDRKRMYDNYCAMIFPVTVRGLYNSYIDFTTTHQDEKQLDEEIKEYMLKKIQEICIHVNKLFCFIDDGDIDNITKIIEDFKVNYLDKVYDRIKKIFDKQILLIGTKEAEECMDLLFNWKMSFIEKLNIKEIIAQDFAGYINNNVNFYCNFTKSEPIEEFLNINENKTSFVISDYIKARMMIDLASKKDYGEDNNKVVEKKEREEILEIFSALSNFFYNPVYKRLWDMVKRGYLSEEYRAEKNQEAMEKVNSDIYLWEKSENRLKILFYDRYNNTSLTGFNAINELGQIKYFKYILNQLAECCEMGNLNRKNQFIYNALWNLYMCTHDRFFYVFSKPAYVGIVNSLKSDEAKDLEPVIIEEYNAYLLNPSIEQSILKIVCDASGRKNTWYIQYFFESIMHSEEYKVDKLDNILEEKKQQVLDSIQHDLYTDDWVCWDNTHSLQYVKHLIDTLW